MKLFQLLTALSKEELKLLKKAVSSPIYNTNQKVVRLFDILRPLHPHFDVSAKGLPKIYKKLFPKEVYKESKLQWHFTSLTKVVEHLLLHIAQEKKPLKRKERLIETYRERNLDDLFFRGNKNLLEELEVDTTPIIPKYIQQFQLHSDKYFHPLHNKYDVGDRTLHQAMENLDSFFILQKLRIAIALISRGQLLGEEYDIYFLEAIKAAKFIPFIKENKLIQLYVHALVLTENSGEVDFETFEATLFNKNAIFENTDQQFLFFTGLNYVIKKCNNGEEQFKEKPLLWYQFGLKTKRLFVENKMGETTFANIIIFGCKAEAFNWVKTFIADYSNSLRTENIEETTQYYYGLVYYLEGNLDKSLDYLMVSGKKSVFPPRKRAILVRVLFEKYLKDESYKDLLLANLLSFRTTLKNNKKFSKERLINFVNFVEIMQQLTKKIDKKEAPLLIQQWLEEKTANHLPVLSKSWIYEKVANL